MANNYTEGSETYHFKSKEDKEHMEFLLSPMFIKWDDHSDNDDKESSWIECSEDDEDSIESFRFYEDTLENYGKYDGDYDLN